MRKVVEKMMKRKWLIIMLFLALSIFLLVLVGCRNVGESDTVSMTAGQDVSADATAFDALMSDALLSGSVSKVQDGSFQVIPDQTADDGQSMIGTAVGTEDDQNGTTIIYGSDCVFQIASIDSESGDVELSESGLADLKQSTMVAVYGEVFSEGIHATKVVIIRFL